MTEKLSVPAEAATLLSLRQSDLSNAKIGLADLDEQAFGIQDQADALTIQKTAVEDARKKQRAQIKVALQAFLDEIHHMLLGLGATPETLQYYHVDTRTMIVTRNDPPPPT